MKVLVDWNFWDNPKLFRLADLLGRNPTEAGGYLVRLWGFAAEYRADGSLEGLSDSEVAQACNWRGAAAKFVSALRKSGWVDHAQIHEWQAHQGKFIEKIHAERERKRLAYARGLSEESPRSLHAKTPPPSPSPYPSPSPSPYPRKEEEGGAATAHPPSETMEALELALGGNGDAPEADRTPSGPTGLLLAKARAAKVPGKPDTLRSYLEAWQARSDYTRVEQILMDPWTRGKTVIEIQDHFFPKEAGNGSKSVGVQRTGQLSLTAEELNRRFLDSQR